MANRTFYKPESYGSSRVYAEVRILLAGAATSVPLANVDGCDLIASIAHVGGTNKWVVTCKDSFNKVVAHAADLVESVAGGSGDYATAGNVTNEGTAAPITFAIYTWNAAGTAQNDCVKTAVLTLAFRNGNWGVK